MKKIMSEIKKNNTGFTLVEMIVTFAILSVALVAISGFVITGVRSYAKTNREAQIQNEAQTALNQIEDTIVDAALGVSYNVRTDSGDNFVLNDSEVTGEVKDKIIYVFNWDDTQNLITTLLIKYDPAEEKLLYARGNNINVETPEEEGEESEEAEEEAVSGESAGSAVDADSVDLQWDLLAENVKSFSADLSSYKTNKKVYIDFTLEKESTSYATHGIISIRNDVIINGSISEIYQRTEAMLQTTITGVTLATSASSIVDGGMVQCYTTVTGTGYPSQAIYQWLIESVTDYGEITNIDGKFDISDHDSAGYDTIFDSLVNTSDDSGCAAVLDDQNKILTLKSAGDLELLRITAVVSRGTNADGELDTVSASQYIAVKSIADFSITPEYDASLSVNKRIPEGTWATASYSEMKDEEVSYKKIQLYPGNIISFATDITGSHIDLSSDNKFTFSIVSNSGAKASMTSGGVLNIAKDSPKGTIVIQAYPDLAPDMCVYYMVEVIGLFDSGDDKLFMSGAATAYRGDTVQLRLALNDESNFVDNLREYNWDIHTEATNGKTITGSQPTVSATGLVTIPASMSYDYGYSITVTASMKDYPGINATHIIQVPKVSVQLDYEIYNAERRGIKLPQNTINATVKGIKAGSYELQWTMASQTNPNSFATSTMNGSYITGFGDTNEVFISGREPAALSRIWVKASIKGHANCYDTSMIVIGSVDIKLEVDNKNPNRGENVRISATSTNGAFGKEGLSWNIVSVTEEGGKDISADGLVLSETGDNTAAANLAIPADFNLTDKPIQVIVRADWYGIEKSLNEIDENIITIQPCKLVIAGAGSVERGKNADLTVANSYGRDIIWTILDGNDARDSLTINGVTKTCTTSGVHKANLNVPVAYDAENKAAAANTVKVQAQIKDTDIKVIKDITVPAVTLNVNHNGTGTNTHTLTATVTGLTDYELEWGLTDTNNTRSTATDLNSYVIANPSVNPITININPAYGARSEYAYVGIPVRYTDHGEEKTAYYGQKWVLIEKKATELADYAYLTRNTYSALTGNGVDSPWSSNYFCAANKVERFANDDQDYYENIFEGKVTNASTIKSKFPLTDEYDYIDDGVDYLRVSSSYVATTTKPIKRTVHTYKGNSDIYVFAYYSAYDQWYRITNGNDIVVIDKNATIGSVYTSGISDSVKSKSLVEMLTKIKSKSNNKESNPAVMN